MTTYMYSFAEGLTDRLAELDAITSRAQTEFDNDQVLYDILCRAGCVLAVSALEGFLKDISVAIQSDLNTNIPLFSGMPKNMQREFSKKILQFDGVPEPELQKRANQLINFFEDNSVKIDMSAFSYKENVNKNPSVNIVDSAFSRYGINSILHCLGGSRFEVVFDNDSATDFLLRREIRRMRATIYKFPYKKLPGAFQMKDWVAIKGQAVPSSIWHTFIEKLLGRRHSIVHADTYDNPTAWSVLKDDSNKLEILFHGITLAASSFIGSDIG